MKRKKRRIVLICSKTCNQQNMSRLTGCGIKSYCLHEKPWSERIALRRGLCKGTLPVFKRVSKKNHVKLRTARSTQETRD